MRAPITSSTGEALRQSRGPLEQLVLDAVADTLPGFRGGYVSVTAVVNRMKATGARSVSPKTIATVLEQLGYSYIGRSVRPYFVEDQSNRSTIYHLNPKAVVDYFGQWQGYE